MWSGPRTVSTAMMRAWENRPDTVVFDEPLLAQCLPYYERLSENKIKVEMPNG